MSTPLNRVRKKFELMADLSKMVGNNFSNSLLIYGRGGLGKSYTVAEVLKQNGIVYETLRGYASPTALFNYLYDHREGEVILIDDCDSVFKDTVGLNILKSVLETSDVRHVSWLSPSPAVRVQEFRFTSRIIFLSNMSLNKLCVNMEALLSRIQTFHLEMEPDEVISQMKQIALTCEYKDVKKADRLMIVRFFRDNMDEIASLGSKLNFRHYVKALDAFRYDKRSWRKIVTGSLGI